VILVVDDDSDFCETLSDFLSLRGHAVQCAPNGLEALLSLATSEAPPSLIFLDLAMPVIDGWGVLTQLRKDPQLADVPVVIMSGSPDIARRAMELGAIAVLRKPIGLQILLQIVGDFD
jgi:two-component system, chemotaxis family, chemotaxis protein CheY